MIPKVLIIATDNTLARQIGAKFCLHGWKRAICEDSFVGLNLAETERFDVLVIWASMPKLDGLSLCYRLRQNQVETPVIVLHEHYDEVTHVRCLQMGADGYMARPFSLNALYASALALTRRQPRSAKQLLAVGDIVIDKTARLVLRSGERLELRKREYDILLLLAENRGRALRREYLNKATCAYLRGAETNSVDVHISSLRRKLGLKKSKYKLIETVPGVGYRVI